MSRAAVSRRPEPPAHAHRPPASSTTSAGATMSPTANPPCSAPQNPAITSSKGCPARSSSADVSGRVPPGGAAQVLALALEELQVDRGGGHLVLPQQLVRLAELLLHLLAGEEDFRRPGRVRPLDRGVTVGRGEHEPVHPEL